MSEAREIDFGEKSKHDQHSWELFTLSFYVAWRVSKLQLSRGIRVKIQMSVI
jgi:hypothetical protein